VEWIHLAQDEVQSGRRILFAIWQTISFLRRALLHAGLITRCLNWLRYLRADELSSLKFLTEMEGGSLCPGRQRTAQFWNKERDTVRWHEEWTVWNVLRCVVVKTILQ
jgi:hypothetical protein